MQRTFILGEEWIYYKLYCGTRTADTILVDVIKPLTDTLLANNLIDKWFFIRYSDPNPHLRIRFHCSEITNLGNIIQEVKKAVYPYINSGLIWKVQTDTYQREIERYGTNTIAVAEHIFYIDSMDCVAALSWIYEDDLLFMYALKSIDILLHVFNYDLKNKIAFVKPNLQAFKKEFHSNKQLNKQLNKKHQALKQQVETFMTLQSHDEYEPLLILMDKKKKELIEVSNTILKTKMDDTSLSSFLSSIIHMLINRIFRDQQRLHELVCYDSLFRIYQVQLAKPNPIHEF